jgi:ankyrin repeat protein
LGKFGDSTLPEINAVDGRGVTPLFYAVADPAPSIDIVRALLEHGADPNFAMAEIDRVIGYRQSIIEKALRTGDIDIVKLLAAFGADLRFHDDYDFTALIHASLAYREGFLPLIEYLIDEGVELDVLSTYGDSALKSAYLNGHFDLLRLLISAGANPSVLGWTPLQRAIAIGTMAEVSEALDAEQDVERRDSCGMSAMSIALKKGDLPTVKILQAHGADPLATSPDGRPAILDAIAGGSAQVVLWLIKQGALVSDQGSFGRYSPLESAVEAGNLKMVQLLLDLGFHHDPASGWSKILESATERSVILKLLEVGADPQYFSEDGRRAILDLHDTWFHRLDEISFKQYLAGRSPRFGPENPREDNDPFWIKMIQIGADGYAARQKIW